MALIPARSGSKGIPHKNIALFCGKPMLAHSIEQALQSHRIDRTIVSTDSELYASIARQFGAETPFLRPAEISGDEATDFQVFKHALDWFQTNENYRPDICVHLRPTYPTRRTKDIDKAIDLLLSDSSLDSVRSVIKAPETPFKMWFADEQGNLTPAVDSNLYEPYNLPRQILPATYLQNACIDVLWSKTILEQHSMTGKTIRGFPMEHFNDIDNATQMQVATLSGIDNLQGKRFVFDIDGVVATITPNNDYSVAEPIPQNIELINKLYQNGNFIVLLTARGVTTGIDWEVVTREQLSIWQVKYHELHFGKPAADYYIDDKFISINDLRILVGRF